jgi:probable O-glycosylation ligase (exosortase A-associated)
LIRSLFLTAIYLAFFGLGMSAPFVFTLGYAWVDTFRPQSVAMIILNQVPVALIMGGAALGGYFAMDRRSPPRLTLATVLTLLMGFWITASMFWAERPDVGWGKWDWAFKTVMFSAFIPLVIRSRVQIEAFAQTYVFSLAANIVPFGLKTLVSGGGYGHNLGLEGGNSNLAEGGLLSTICLMAIPLALHLGRHTQLLPRSRLVSLGYMGLCGLALVTALGTFERSALIGLLVMGAYMFTRSRHKMLFLACLAVVSVVLVYSMSAGYDARIATISDPTKETSALTRLLVWKYTFNYSLSHPFGGGFMAYLVDRIEFPGGEVVFGRAYHSIYFEVLGEQGWVGLALFLGAAGWTFFDLRRMARRARKLPHLAWCADMSDALQTGLAVFMTAGAFVGIAYQPAFWYFVAMSVSLREYVRRVEQGQPATGWRARSLSAQGMAPAAASAPSWRSGGRQDAARARTGLG